MSLNLLKSILQNNPSLAGRISWDAWFTEQTMLAEQVALARRYADGDHDAKLTEEMKAMLRVAKRQAGAPFNINHCENIIQTVVDRLELSTVETDNTEATAWCQDVLDVNRVDGLQLSLSEAAIRDGNTFVLAYWDNEAGEVAWSHEDAYDGIDGMIVVYGSDQRHPAIAIKLWQETVSSGGTLSENTRINVYYPDRVEKYISGEGSVLNIYETPQPWTVGGEPIGVPVIHFAHQGKRYARYGKSILDDVIPVQDALNRTLISMVMSSELTAFQIRYAIGMKAPAGITPGMWLDAYVKDDKGLTKPPSDDQKRWLDSIRFGSLEQGDVTQFLNVANFLISQMYTVSRIPEPKESSNVSGEALKQLESGLLGRVRRCHVGFGNAWENALMVSARIQAAYGSAPPAATRFYARWMPGAIRNNTEIVDNAVKIRDQVDERTFLQLIAPVFGFDEAKIDEIMQGRAGDRVARLAALSPSNFDGFNLVEDGV